MYVKLIRVLQLGPEQRREYSFSNDLNKLQPMSLLRSKQQFYDLNELLPSVIAPSSLV